MAKDETGGRLNQWCFMYKVGPAPKNGIVLGKDEAEGYAVAVHWCKMNGFRPPAKVFPVILAGPEILKQKIEPRDPSIFPPYNEDAIPAR